MQAVQLIARFIHSRYSRAEGKRYAVGSGDVVKDKKEKKLTFTDCL